MATVYILHSSSIDFYYVGSCKDLDQRLLEHNSDAFKKGFTSRATDWEVYLRVDDLSYEQARKMEIHIKKMKSRKYIENLYRYPEMLDKLKLRYL